MIQTKKTPKPFSNKIDTLLYLKDKLSASYVLDLYSFSVGEYRNKPGMIYEKISTLFCEQIIIRSSASTEDQYSTNAGHFISSQHVDSQDKNSVFKGIESVINSYEKDGLSDSELMFVQKQLTNVVLSGVALSLEPKFGKPYFLINFDDSGSTNSVTSGKCKRYMYIARDYVYQTDSIEAKLCAAFLEVERCCENSNLNIEFALTEEGKIYILQVRRLRAIPSIYSQKEILDLKNTYKYEYASKNTLFSDMAFWNPSEMIGDAPHPLDYSLYNYLITEYAWNKGIAEIGYFMTNKSIMNKIGNKPFIDLKIAFCALTPSCLNNSIREKLVNYYCRVLLNNKNLHDKIEFEIVHSCYDFSTDKKLLLLLDHGFSREEIAVISEALYQNTKLIIEQYNIILENDLKKLDFLERELKKYRKLAKINTTENMLEIIQNLLLIIRDYGAVPFARQARCAFIAQSICRSLVDSGQIDFGQLAMIMQSINSVANELRIDTLEYKRKKITNEEMGNKYGHLRSNTYNISSLSYKEIGINKIFDCVKCENEKEVDESIFSTLRVYFPNTKIDLMSFIKNSIAQREYFKFIYSRALSYVLELITKLAKQFKLSREDISFITIEDILNIRCDSYSQQRLLDKVASNKWSYFLKTNIILPSIISQTADFDVIRVSESEPNFITCKSVVGEICVIDKLGGEYPDISGKIVVLVNADPGYDWIFANSIAGLITKYGGMASHMAIRCMEFGIPAAIGCGELIYNYVVNSKRIRLDCSAKEVAIV